VSENWVGGRRKVDYLFSLWSS